MKAFRIKTKPSFGLAPMYVKRSGRKPSFHFLWTVWRTNAYVFVVEDAQVQSTIELIAKAMEFKAEELETESVGADDKPPKHKTNSVPVMSLEVARFWLEREYRSSSNEARCEPGEREKLLAAINDIRAALGLGSIADNITFERPPANVIEDNNVENGRALGLVPDE